jgi:hypothetical protein
LKGKVHGMAALRESPFLFAVIGIVGFCISVVALTTLHIGSDFSEVPVDGFFFLQNIPFAYWLGICLLVLSILYVGCLNKGWKWSVILSGLLIISMRIVLNVGLTNSLNFDSIVRDVPNMISWLDHGIFFIQNYYSQMFPLSYLIAYTFTSAGIPVNIFYEWAAIPIYLIDAYLVFIIASLLVNKNQASLAVFLFALISLTVEGGILTQFYNPQLIGSMFYLLSLYLTLRLVKTNVISWKGVSIACISIFLMILSHHLTVVYFILTISGVWLISKTRLSLFSSLNFKIFPFLTIFTSIAWVAYSLVMYPEIFLSWISDARNIILLGHKFVDINSVSLGAFLNQPLFDMITFVAVPLFIGGLFLIYLGREWRSRAIHSNKLSSILNIFNDQLAFLTIGMIWILGFIFLIGLIFNGLLYPIRNIEFILSLLAPIGAISLLDLLSHRSIKVRILIILLAIIVTFLSIYWTYHIFQRTIPLWVNGLFNPR